MNAFRKIWARGLTLGDRGKKVTISDKNYLLRGFEHTGDETVLTVVTSITLRHNEEIIVHD